MINKMETTNIDLTYVYTPNLSNKLNKTALDIKVDNALDTIKGYLGKNFVDNNIINPEII